MVRQDVAWSNRGNIGEHSGQWPVGTGYRRCEVSSVFVAGMLHRNTVEVF